jgi:hypothetical protein
MRGLAPLSQRVKGSSPCAPTIELIEMTLVFDRLLFLCSVTQDSLQDGLQTLFPFRASALPWTAIAGSRLKSHLSTIDLTSPTIWRVMAAISCTGQS